MPSSEVSIGDVIPEAGVAPPSKTRRSGWLRLSGVLGVLLFAAWVAFGGYDRLTEPNPRWKLPNGDTIEVLGFTSYYQGSYSLTGRGASGTHFLRLRFRSTLHDPARDRRDVRAAADVMCPIADSSGIRKLLIQPTRASFFDLLKVSLDHVFQVRSRRDCEEIGNGG